MAPSPAEGPEAGAPGMSSALPASSPSLRRAPRGSKRGREPVARHCTLSRHCQLRPDDARLTEERAHAHAWGRAGLARSTDTMTVLDARTCAREAPADARR